MDKQVMRQQEIEIDLMHLLKLLWKRAWIIVIAMVVFAAMFFSYAKYFITPQYNASATMYVNSSAINVGTTGISINGGQLSAARYLLDTYVVIMKTRTTLEAVIDRAGLNMSAGQLSGMISASSINDTAVFRITATSSDPAEAQLIVNTMVDVLPDRLEDIVNGSSVRVVDRAVLPTGRSSPNYTRYATLGMLVGFVLSAAIIIILDLLDSSVRDEEYLNQRYDIPVLAVIPDVYGSKGKYGKYGKYYAGYYGHNGSSAQPEASKKGKAD